MSGKTNDIGVPFTAAERLIVRLICGHCGLASDKPAALLLARAHPIACDTCDSHIDLDSPDNKALVEGAFDLLERIAARDG